MLGLITQPDFFSTDLYGWLMRNSTQPLAVASEGDNPLATGRYPEPSWCASFDGSDDYIDLGDKPSFELDDFIFASTVRRKRTGVFDAIAGLQSQVTTVGGIAGVLIRFTDDDTVAALTAVGGNWTHATSIDTYTDTSAWLNVVLAKSGVNISLYVGGVLVASAVAPSSAVDYATSGTKRTLIGAYWNGDTDLAAINGQFNMARQSYAPYSADRLTQALAGDVMEGCLFNLPLNQSSGTLALSKTETNPATLVNGVTWVVDNTMPWQADSFNNEGGSKRTYFGGADHIDFGGQLAYLNTTTNPWQIRLKFIYDGSASAQRLLAQQDGSPFDGVSVYVNQNDVRVDLGNASGNRIIKSSDGFLLQAGVLYDVIVDYDGSKLASGMIISVNANTTNTVIENTLTANTLTCASNLSVGASSLATTPTLFLVGSVWDVEINNGSGTVLFAVDGYGATPWEDTAGSLDGTVVGSLSTILIPPSTVTPTNDGLGNELDYSGSVYPTPPVPKNSYALRLTGTEYGNVNVANYRSGDSSGSILARFKTSSATTQVILGASDKAGDANFFVFSIDSAGSVYIQARENPASNRVATTNSFADGEWHTAIVTSNGSSWSIEVDGVDQPTTVVSGSDTGEWFSAMTLMDNLAIGTLNRTTPTAYFIGDISLIEVRDGAGALVDRYTNCLGVGATLHSTGSDANHMTLVNASTGTKGAGAWAGRISGHGTDLNRLNGFSQYLNFDGANDRAVMTFDDHYDVDNVEITGVVVIQDIDTSAYLYGSRKDYDDENSLYIYYNSSTKKFHATVGTSTGGYNVSQAHIIDLAGITNHTLLDYSYTFDGVNSILTVNGLVSSVARTENLYLPTNSITYGMLEATATSDVWGKCLHKSLTIGRIGIAKSRYTKPSFVDDLGHANGTLSGSPYTVFIPADSTNPTLDVFGEVLTNPPVVNGFNDSETTYNAYEVTEDGQATAMTQHLANFNAIAFSDTSPELEALAPVDSVFRRDRASVSKDRLVAFHDTITGADRLKALAYTSPDLEVATVNFISESGATDVSGLNSLLKYVRQQGLMNNFVIYPMKSTQNAGSGSTVYGVGGLTANDIALTGSPTWGADGITFNGTNQWGKVTSFPTVRVSDGFACFARLTKTTESNSDTFSSTNPQTIAELAQDSSIFNSAFIHRITGGKHDLTYRDSADTVFINSRSDTHNIDTADQTLVFHSSSGATSLYNDNAEQTYQLQDTATGKSVASGTMIIGAATLTAETRLLEAEVTAICFIKSGTITTQQRETITNLINAL